MVELRFRSLRLFAVVLPLVLLLCGVSHAQDKKVEALSLVQSAMSSYSQLDLDSAQARLEEAIAMAAELDDTTLARIYVSYGVVWIGGFADNATGQEHFQIGLCLDPSINVDPMVSTPDIDMIFTMAKNQQADCTALLATVRPSGSPPTPTLPSCGGHQALFEQKKKYELPFYIDVNPQVRPTLSRIVVKYAFDASASYSELQLQPRGSGFGQMLDCEFGQIHIFDPSTIAYYIEGYDSGSQPICANGSKESPFEIMMMPEAQPLAPVAGMSPTECSPCSPWDEECLKKKKTDNAGGFYPGDGEICQPDIGCQMGYMCGKLGICEPDDGPVNSGDRIGMKSFYINVLGGIGVGYVKQTLDVRDWLEEEEELASLEVNIPGMAWSGIPLRMSAGFFLPVEGLSLEISGRFDAWVTDDQHMMNCQEGMDSMEEAPWCYKDYGPDATPEELQKSAWFDGNPSNPDSSPVLSDPVRQVAWLINLRARYQLVHQGGMVVSLFGGLGYAKMKFRVPGADGEIYFPMVGGFNIELGPSLAYYFNDHVGIILDVPIDFVIGDGFGFNFDFNLGMGFGF